MRKMQKLERERDKEIQINSDKGVDREKLIFFLLVHTMMFIVSFKEQSLLLVPSWLGHLKICSFTL